MAADSICAKIVPESNPTDKSNATNEDPEWLKAVKDLKRKREENRAASLRDKSSSSQDLINNVDDNSSQGFECKNEKDATTTRDDSNVAGDDEPEWLVAIKDMKKIREERRRERQNRIDNDDSLSNVSSVVKY